MIGCLRPIIALYFEFETVLNFYNLEARISRDEAQFIFEVTKYY